PARPHVWAGLRQLCLSVMDGGPRPAGTPTGGGSVAGPAAGSAASGPREVLTDPWAVVPDSSLPGWTMPDDVCGESPGLAVHRGTVLRPCDPATTDQLATDLGEARAGLTETV